MFPNFSLLAVKFAIFRPRIRIPRPKLYDFPAGTPNLDKNDENPIKLRKTKQNLGTTKKNNKKNKGPKTCVKTFENNSQSQFGRARGRGEVFGFGHILSWSELVR